MTIDSEQFKKAIELIDAANSQDPNKEVWQEREYPKELLYAQRMTQWLECLAPNASEVLRLAARSQHICRWMIPRSQYPMNRTGYLKWRTTLYGFHSKKTGEIMIKVGYDQKTIEQVQILLSKKDLKTNSAVQLLEDVICLVFLENYFADFSKKHEEGKILSIITKTWQKMSPQGRRMALNLRMSSDVSAIVKKALAQQF